MGEKKNFNLEKVLFFLFGLLVVLLPLFFLPFNDERQGMDAFNKFLLLWEMAPLLLVLWYFISLRNDSFRPVWSKSDWFIIIFGGVSALSTVFSLDKFSSLTGSVGSIVSPLLGLLGFVILYFFLTNYYSVQSKHRLFSVVRWLFYGFIITNTAGLLLLINPIKKSEILSGGFREAVGNLQDFSLYLAVLSVLFFTIVTNRYLSNRVFFGWRLKVARLVLLMALLVLFQIDFPVAWGVLFAGAFFSCFAQKKFLKKQEPRPVRQGNKFKYAWSFLFIIIPGLVLLTHIFVIQESKSTDRLRKSLQLDAPNSLAIAKQSIKKNPILGTGPETFPYAYSAYRLAEMNTGPYWYLRFNQPYSYILGLVVAVGGLGALSYIAMVMVFLIMAIRWLIALKAMGARQRDISVAIMFIAPWLTLLISQFFYPQNAVLLFLFWLFLGLWMAWRARTTRGRDIKIYNKINHAYIYSVVTVSIFLIFTGWLLLVGFDARIWLGEYNFYLGTNAKEADRPAYLEKAVKINPYRYYYYTELSKTLKAKAVAVIANFQEGDDLTEAQDTINQSINWAKKAVDTAPFYVVPYERIGIIYRDITPYSDGAEILSAKAFFEALEKEPTNPILANELGKAYMDTGSVDKAIEAFKKAASLKPDYYEAQLQLAKAYTEAKNYDDSLAILNDLAGKYNNAEIVFEQGRVFYNQNEYEEAIAQFREVIRRSPNNANAMYSLGLALEATEDYEGAVYYFRKVLALNPGNNDVEMKIQAVEEKISHRKVEKL